MYHVQTITNYAKSITFNQPVINTQELCSHSQMCTKCLRRQTHVHRWYTSAAQVTLSAQYLSVWATVRVSSQALGYRFEKQKNKRKERTSL